MSEKTAFISQLRSDASNLAQLVRAVSDRPGVWASRQYGVGLDNEITDSDAQEAGLASAAQAGAMITLLEQLAEFVGNKPVVQGDYQSTLNTVRNDL